LSFNLGDLIILPTIKEERAKGRLNDEVDEVWDNYNMGFITNNERYNQIDRHLDTYANNTIDRNLMKDLSPNDHQGFNSVYMMLDSGARGSKEQIKSALQE
jgi:DNA-directed RNA polymerase subunit beta'